MIVHKLPKEWCSIKFGDCIQESFTGLVKSAKEQSIENPYDYLKMNNLNFDGSFDLTNMVKVEATESEVLKYSLRDSDFLFNTRNSVELVGKCGIFSSNSNRSILFNNNLLKVRFIEVIPEIVAYWFNCPTGKQNLRDITSATTSVAAIYQKQLIGLDIPVPPLAEQKVIADKLYSLLTLVETTKARFDRVPDILKRFRQSVLAAAVSGRLIPRKSPYQAKKLDSLCLPESSITYGVIKLGKEVEGGIPCLRTSNVRWLNIETHSIKRIASDISENYSRTVLGGGEVLVNVRGTLGGVAVVPNEMTGWNVSREVAVVPLDSNLVDAKFIALWIASRQSQQWLADVSKGVAYVGINLKDLRDLPVELPNTLEEQREIVRFVEDNFAFADAVEHKAQAASERVNKLTQSILAKAFRGELTADWRAANPDLISGENSAEALLEKIKAEREALNPKKKTRAGKS